MTENEHKIYNYGILVGELETIAEFNSQSNRIYDFRLERIPKSGHPNDILFDRIEKLADSYELNFVPIQNALDHLSKVLKEKWFFALDKMENHHPLSQDSFFSLYDPSFQKTLVNDFVNFLLQSLSPLAIYAIKLGTLKEYRAIEFDHFLFECQEVDYHFSLSVTH